MSKTCNYLIRSNGGEFLLEFPSDSSIGSNRDFETAFYKYLTEHKIDKKTFSNSLINISKELVLPAEVKSVIVGQESLSSVSNDFSDTRLRRKIKYLSDVLTKDWRSKKDKTQNPSTKQNIVFCSLDEKFDYEYNKDHDVIFINISKTVDKNNILKASLERAVNILGLSNGDKSAAQLLKEHDANVFNALRISETSDITPSDISYLYFNHNNFNKESIVPYLASKKDTYLQVVEKYSDLSSTDKRNDNYEPKSDESVFNLKQGDLILLNSDKELSKVKTAGYYSLFIDYSIDGNGNYVVKAISPNSKFPETRTLTSPIVSARIQRLSSDIEDISEMNLSGPFHTVKLEAKSFFNHKFLFKTLKRGDKITIGVSDYVVLNIKGAKFEVQNSKGEKSIIEDFSKINAVKLNSKVHGNLEFVKSELSNDFKEIKLQSAEDKNFIEENDIVGWEGGNKGLVVYKNNQVLYVKNFTSGEIEKLYTNAVSSHYIYIKNNQDILPIAEVSKDLASIDSFKYGDWLESDHNWVEYYKGFQLSRGDVIIKNNIPMIVLSSENGYNRVYVSGEYLLFSDNQLTGAVVATNRPQDPRFAEASINKNQYYVSNNPDEYKNSYEINLIKNEDTGQIKAIPVKSEIKPHYTLLNNSFKEEKGYNKNDKLYAFTGDTGIAIKKAYHTNPVYNVRENLQSVFSDIIPGTFIKFGKESADLKYWLVERKVGDTYIISHSYNRVIKENGKKRVEIKTVKKLFRMSDSIDELRLPTYATAVLEKMNKAIGIKMSKDITTFADKEILTNSQSPEIIFGISELLKDKYKINVNFVTSEELSEMDVDPEVRAAVINGEYFINTDKATIAEPLHEFLHMVLASMKFSNYDMYRTLISSVASHPLFKEVTAAYGDTAFDNLEETFIRLFSDTVSNKIAEDGVFTEEAFDNAIREGVKNMLNLQGDLSDITGMELLTSDIKTVLQSFESNLIDNMTPLYNKENSKAIIEASTVIREFIKNGNLNEECNGL